MLNSRHFARPIVTVLFAVIGFLGVLPSAYGQANFTLTASPLKPSAVDAGGFALSTITVGAINGFNSAVALTCAVTPQQTSDTPVCTLSQSSVTPPAQPTLTITTSTLTPATFYTVAVTGTASSGSQTISPPLSLTVLTAIPSYTLTVTNSITPTSLHAGSKATAVLTVTPVNGYTGKVTLSCSKIAPAVTPAPVCAFTPQPVVITNGSGETSTLTITTTGPSAAGFLPARSFFTLWLPVCGLCLIGRGLGSARARRKQFWRWLFFLAVLIAGVLGTISCAGGGSSSTSSSGNTPNNTYVFTVTGLDASGVAPSNGAQTLDLIVN